RSIFCPPGVNLRTGPWLHGAEVFMRHAPLIALVAGCGLLVGAPRITTACDDDDDSDSDNDDDDNGHDAQEAAREAAREAQEAVGRASCRERVEMGGGGVGVR